MVTSMHMWSGDPSSSVKCLLMVHAHIELKINGFCRARSQKDEWLTVGDCIEPMKANYKLLKTSFHTTGYNKDIQLVEAASSLTTGMAKYPIM
jgi:hypothetical protein